MAWAIRCRFNRIQSYKDAAKVWQKADIFPRDIAGPRGLDGRRKRHLTIEKTDAEDFILRLYSHPVVTWHKDDSFTLDLHSSLSTSIFANHCTPPEVYVSCGKHKTSSVSTNKLCYKATKPITFVQRDGKWKMKDRSQIDPWSVPVVNRGRAKQAFAEVGYDEFRAWLKVYVQMSKRPEPQHGWMNNTNIVNMLRGREWRDLLARRFPNAWTSPDSVLSEIRKAIYDECDCIDHIDKPFLG